MHPTSNTMAAVPPKNVDKHDDLLANDHPSGSTENITQNNDPINVQFAMRSLVRILYIALANHNAPFTALSERHHVVNGIVHDRHESQLDLLSTQDTVQAMRKELLDARAQIATMSKEQRDLELTNQRLQAAIKEYEVVTHEEQKMVQQHKEELKNQMKFVKQYEGELIDKRRTMAKEQEKQRATEKALMERMEDMDQRSIEMWEMEARLMAKQKALNEQAFRLHLKQETIDERSQALRIKEDELQSLKDTTCSTDVGITADTAVPNMALCHRQNVPNPRNSTASPVPSVMSEHPVPIESKGCAADVLAMEINASLPPHLRAITNNQSSHILVPLSVQQTIDEMRTANRRNKQRGE